ncbi:MAG TPA: radical SAM protein [Thiolapillus brandeum]|uniref:Radical SAM protein n=1 Tax=Thiolapillus brandeum TaxID=1076588 RepID=A0A831K2N0_9GAMM|nr:radical SAM protein [Thiolapillus brandeum]
MNDELFLLAVNLTRRCNLACAHCYMDAETRDSGDDDELSRAEVEILLDEIASRSNETMVVLTGGEPLLRRDLEALVEHGSKLGLSMVVGSNGVLLTQQRVQSLKAAGAMGIGISLDSLDPDSHDSFRGCPGSWEKTLAGMDHCRQHELPFQVHFSVTEQNAHEVQPMIDFARASGAHVLNIFFLVCTGRGESMSDISPARYEQVLKQLVEAQENSKDLIIRARCAPHYKRVVYEHNPESPLTRAQGYEGGGCLAGSHYCRITPEGAVTACPYIPDEEGSIRSQGFWEIWDQSATFHRLRNPELKGKCGKCEYQKLCGGCRARPLAMGGDIMDADPWCGHMPSNKAIIQPLVEQNSNEITWTDEANRRLQCIPGFLRKMVRKRAEAHVQELGETTVTTEHLNTLAANRFGDNFPMRRPTSNKAEPTLSWTTEAKAWLNKLPGFLREGIFTVAEDVARNEGRLEVNIKLLQRLEAGDSNECKLPWEDSAENQLDELLAKHSPQAALFVKPSMQAAAEREAKRRSAIVVTTADVDKVFSTNLACVEWSAEALSRVLAAPDFIRGGIKKAAEFGARREGIEIITPEDLTRFRNRAMMKAVRRMKGFGMQELNFNAFDIAKNKVPRLKENQQAAKRFAKIQQYVKSRQNPETGGLGLLDRELLDKMKAELKKK